MSNGGVGIAWLGAVIMFVGGRLAYIFDYWSAILIIGLVITIIGCVLWVQRKHRHVAFALWGLLAPIGFLGIALLKDKTNQRPTQN